MFIKKHHISLKHALDGIYYNLRTQPNFRIHLIATIITSIMGIIVRLSYLEWLILLFTFVLVISAEMLNTALEAIVDLLTDKQQQAAKIAKDTAAGMVLVSALGAIVVGLFILAPKLIILLTQK